MFKKIAVGVSLIAASVSSFAAMDTSGVTGALTDAGAAVAVVGGAVLVAYVGVKAFSLVRSALGR